MSQNLPQNIYWWITTQGYKITINRHTFTFLPASNALLCSLIVMEKDAEDNHWKAQYTSCNFALSTQDKFHFFKTLANFLLPVLLPWPKLHIKNLSIKPWSKKFDCMVQSVVMWWKPGSSNRESIHWHRNWQTSQRL